MTCTIPHKKWPSVPFLPRAHRSVSMEGRTHMPGPELAACVSVHVGPRQLCKSCAFLVVTRTLTTSSSIYAVTCPCRKPVVALFPRSLYIFPFHTKPILQRRIRDISVNVYLSLATAHSSFYSSFRILVAFRTYQTLGNEVMEECMSFSSSFIFWFHVCVAVTHFLVKKKNPVKKIQSRLKER